MVGKSFFIFFPSCFPIWTAFFGQFQCHPLSAACLGYRFLDHRKNSQVLTGLHGLFFCFSRKERLRIKAKLGKTRWSQKLGFRLRNPSHQTCDLRRTLYQGHFMGMWSGYWHGALRSEGPILDSMPCCHHLGILSNFWIGARACSFWIRHLKSYSQSCFPPSCKTKGAGHLFREDVISSSLMASHNLWLIPPFIHPPTFSEPLL